MTVATETSSKASGRLPLYLLILLSIFWLILILSHSMLSVLGSSGDNRESLTSGQRALIIFDEQQNLSSGNSSIPEAQDADKLTTAEVMELSKKQAKPSAQGVDEPVTELTSQPESEEKSGSLASKTSLPTQPSVETPLRNARNPALQEQRDGMILPIIAEDGLMPWQYYAKPFTFTKGQPVIALVIRDVGLHSAHTQQALQLNEYVTMAVNPYTASTASLIKRIRQAGHEVWLEAPLEPRRYPADDAGPLSLLKSEPWETNREKFFQLLDRGTGYVGLVGNENEVFSGYNLMNELADELQQRGLLMLLHREQFSLPKFDDALLNVQRTVSTTASAAELQQTLAELEAIASSKGYAIGSLPAAPAFFPLINQWADEVKQTNTRLGPLSAAMIAKQAQ